MHSAKTLVGSGLIINLPPNYQVVSHQGIDYENYHFVPTDTTNKTAAIGGIILGLNVACHEHDIDSAIQKDTISSILFGNKTNWIIYNFNSVYLAESFSNHEYCASIYAKNKNDILKFIKVFTTLRDE